MDLNVYLCKTFTDNTYGVPPDINTHQAGTPKVKILTLEQQENENSDSRTSVGILVFLLPFEKTK